MNRIISIFLFLVFSISTTASNDQKNFLIIHGTNIWVRKTPATGKVVMKLNEGDRCKILNKKRLEIIRGNADYWYNIEFKGKKGWVFGSQTSVKMANRSRNFSSLGEVVKAFEFDSDKLPDSEEWEGDRSQISHISTLQEQNFAIVSFNSPGYMSSSNFSWLGFKHDDTWMLYEFNGEGFKIISKNGKLFVMMYVRSTGGAYTIDNDYILYSINLDKRSFQQHQIVFNFANSFDNNSSEPVYGNATLKFLDKNNDQFTINETIKKDYKNDKEEIIIKTYNFNYETMIYKEITKK